MKRCLKFSLKTIFVLITVAACGIYWIPVNNQVVCDFRGSLRGANGSVGKWIDIEGRSELQAFEPVIENVLLVSVERSKNPRVGLWKITIRCNLHNWLKLRKYEILRFRQTSE